MANRGMDLGPFGIQWGWRPAYIVVSMIAVVGSAASFFIMPRVPQHELTEEEKAVPASVIAKEEIRAMLSFFKYTSFGLMILQGMFGSIPWLVLGNNLLYCQLCNITAAEYVPIQLVGFAGIIGGILGGVVSDFLVLRVGPSGRPLSAVISVGIGVPLMFTLYQIIPPESINVPIMFVIFFAFNTLCQWPQPGCNFPVIGQIVTSDNRNKIICWEMALENTMATILGAQLPYFLSVLLGYGAFAPESYPDYDMARKLGNVQAIATCGPWTICFFVYASLMWSFPRDLKRIENEKAEELGTQLVGQS